MYTLIRSCTNKPRKNNKEGHWYTYDRDEKKFLTMEDVKKWLQEEYGDCKREKMYRDGKDGEAVHVGYIFCYTAPPCSYDDCHHYMQDWIEVVEYEPHTVVDF